MDYQEMKKNVLQGLEAAGWKAVDEISMTCTSCVAKKTFHTAVGLREALAHFTDSPAECCRLSGEYYSEGNNALSTTSFYVWYRPRPTSPETIDVPCYRFKLRDEVTPEDLVDGAKVFAELAEKAIAKTYAVRLLQPGS